MIKKILSLIIILMALSAKAEVLTPQAALERTGLSFNGRSISDGHSATPLLTLKDRENQPAIYVFSDPANHGIFIASAEDTCMPLLGYTDSGEFDAENMPPQLMSWLEGYCNQIDYARQTGLTASVKRRAPETEAMAAISPLLKSKWNQGTPYNKYCFEIASDGKQSQSVTGCVATSMAQIMYYFQYPEVGKGEISYKHGNSGTYSMNFSSQNFEWADMLDTYYPDSYTETEADAVAYLMKACGYSVKMDYGAGESGANGAAIAGALIEYFGYNDGITVETRKFYTYNDWAAMIHKNLSETGPVVYNGSALDGGHSFVCDGYDGNGYFHFNWGWGGMADGYYLLDALNPDEYGIGGAAGGYNLGQQIILGITNESAPQPERHLMQTGNLSGSLDGSTLSFKLTESDDPGFQYIDPAPVTITFGLMVTNTKDESAVAQYIESDKKNVSCKEGDFYRWEEIDQKIDLDVLGMKEGDVYNIYTATEITVSGSSYWSVTVPYPGYYNYVTITRTSEGYQLKNYETEDLEVSDFSAETSPIYENLPVKFKATFTNPASTQLTRNYSAEFFNAEGKKCFTMENFSITVDAGTSVSQEWTSVQWYKATGAPEITEPTSFTLKLYDNWEENYIDGIESTVTISPEPKDTKVEATLSLPGAEKEDEIYTISGTRFEVTVTVKVTSGFFSSPINLDIEVPLKDGGYYSVQSKRFDTVPSLAAGEEQELSMTIDFPDAVSGKEYLLQAWSRGAQLGDHLTIKFNTESLGTGQLAQEGEEMYHVFTLTGIKVLETKDKTSLYNLPSGIYIINGKKVRI